MSGFVRIESCPDQATAERRRTALATGGFTAVVVQGSVFNTLSTVALGADGTPAPQDTCQELDPGWHVIATRVAG